MVIIGYNGLIKSLFLIDDDWEWFDKYLLLRDADSKNAHERGKFP